ncbi:hypothetical protein ACLESO_28220 [Pyxidicoccus sp. 3LG]
MKGKVDCGIITIREDEFEAVLARFPVAERVTGHRQYNLSRVALPGGGSYLVAVLRCIEQGNGEAQTAARDLLEDLAPKWLLVVGIAGGVPSEDFSLGDVVVSTRVHDFSVEAVIQGRDSEYALAGGPVEKPAAALAANIPALRGELGGWNTPVSIAAERPSGVVSDELLYGDEAWKRSVRQSLLHHARRVEPRAVAGAIASSDRLVKDVEVLAVWKKMVRSVMAVEMESAGVYRATYGRQVPTLSIRGVSDIVGLARDPAWTRYACHTAAAFALALMRTRPFGSRADVPPQDAFVAPVARPTGSEPLQRHSQEPPPLKRKSTSMGCATPVLAVLGMLIVIGLLSPEPEETGAKSPRRSLLVQLVDGWRGAESRPGTPMPAPGTAGVDISSEGIAGLRRLHQVRALQEGESGQVLKDVATGVFGFLNPRGGGELRSSRLQQRAGSSPGWFEIHKGRTGALWLVGYARDADARQVFQGRASRIVLETAASAQAQTAVAIPVDRIQRISELDGARAIVVDVSHGVGARQER